MPSSAEGSRTSSSLHEKSDLEKTEVKTQVIPIEGFDDPNWDKDAEPFEDDSPYPEVRSAVSNTDDPDMPVSTIRAWFLGIFWAILLGAMNKYFIFRSPTVFQGPIVPQLVSVQVGMVWTALMPKIKIFGAPLNPGPLTIKEHVLIVIIGSVGAQAAYAADLLVVQRIYYGQIYNFGYNWFVIISTQMIGFSIAGLARRFLVDPPSMIWPAILPRTALFYTLHNQTYPGMGTRGGIRRDFFFFAVFGISFTWYFFPGYIFTALSAFSWVSWIAPHNVKVNQLFGYNSGLGMSFLTFDWFHLYPYFGFPLAWPWWASANILFGFVFFFWLIAPILYYTNTWYSKYLPMSSRTPYDRFGNPYNVSRIINPNNTLNVEAYTAYSPMYLTTTFALSYGLTFASITATITHTILYYRRFIWVQAKKSSERQVDVHSRLMSRYPQVPEWWYAVIFVVTFVFGVIAIEVWPTQLPVWAFLLALAISFVYVIPIGIIQAITNQQVGLSVLAELIVGYALPGRPVAMMMFKTWGHITMVQALNFTSDAKICHYMKIPPRIMFWGQIIGTVVAATAQLGVQAWMFTNIDHMCDPHQTNRFICPNTHVFGEASVFWGLVGPARTFSKGQLYYPLLFFFLIGAILPFGAWLVQKKWPNSIIKYLNWPVIFSGMGSVPPASGHNYVTWALVGFLFNYVIKRRHFSWWAKYNYVLSATLEAGLAFSIGTVFFTLLFPLNQAIGVHSMQTWWGNTVYKKTADAANAPLIQLAPGQAFGPSVWY